MEDANDRCDEWWSRDDALAAEDSLRDASLAAAAISRRRSACLGYLLPDLVPDGRGPQGKKARREQIPFTWDAHLLLLTEEEFKRRYRLDFDSFNELLEKIRPALELSRKEELQSKRGNFGIVVSAEVKLAICLRYLAGGDVLDLKLIYHVGRTYVYDCVYLCIDAINRALVINFPIDDPEKLQQMEAEFRAASRGGIWAGQVGAIDGVHFAMRGVGTKDVPDPMKYHVARKDEYALLCIAICDAHRRFTYYDISKAPTTHDSLAWAGTELGARVAQGHLQEPFFLNGDAAFSQSNSMITPSGDPALDSFDFHQSSNRMSIECAFGMLVRKWGVFWRPLSVAFPRRAALVAACLRLHNFCIDRRIEDPQLPTYGNMTEVQPQRLCKTPVFDREGRPVAFLDTRLTQDEMGNRPDYRRQASCTRRDLLVQAVVDSGLARPPPRRKDAVVKKKKKRGGKKK